MNDNIPRPVAYAIREGVHPVKAFREYAGISLSQLARESGMERPRLSLVESRLVSLSFDEAVRLSETLDVPILHLHTKPSDLAR